MDTEYSCGWTWSMRLPGGIETLHGDSVTEVLDEAVYVLRNYCSAICPPNREANARLIAHIDSLLEPDLRNWLAAGAVLPE